MKYGWEPSALRKAALLVWKSICRYACAQKFRHAKTYCFINAEELLLVSIRSFGLENLDSEIPSLPDLYLLCPASIADGEGTIHKPLVLFCQRNWPEVWNSQTSSDEDILRNNSDNYNFGKAREWYKYPIREESPSDFWSNKLNAPKRRKCDGGQDVDTDNDDDDDVEFIGAKEGILDNTVLPSPDDSVDEVSS